MAEPDRDLETALVDLSRTPLNQLPTLDDALVEEVMRRFEVIGERNGSSLWNQDKGRS